MPELLKLLLFSFLYNINDENHKKNPRIIANTNVKNHFNFIKCSCKVY